MSWEAEVTKWESEPYWLYAPTLEALLVSLPDESLISHLDVWQIGNPYAG